jgi:ectoine hydroxylase-related dioxygenase (phytanoyl-CoA dioxygenase family)
MFMNKAAGKGTWLPWHQDRWNFLDQDPLLTVWIPLDEATLENGCVQIIRRSHRKGLINPEHSSGFLTEVQAIEHASAEDIVPILVEPGDLVVLHNHLLHASDKNRTSSPRRALSVCYMNGYTKNIAEPEISYPQLFTT